MEYWGVAWRWRYMDVLWMEGVNADGRDIRQVTIFNLEILKGVLRLQFLLCFFLSVFRVQFSGG